MGAIRKTVLYFLSDQKNLTYSIEEDGTITKNAIPTPIKDNPIGSQDLQIAFATNTKYWSLNRSFTVPLTFVNEGADILRSLVYNGRGYEEEVYLTILKWNPLFIDVNGKEGAFELEFKGKIDFTKLKDDPTQGVTVNVIEGGVLSFLNSNDSVVYELPCDQTNKDCVRVKFDGIELFDRYKYSFFEFEIQLPSHATGFTIPFTYLSNEGDSVGILTGAPTYEETTDVPSYVANSANYFFSSSVAGSYPMSGQLVFQKTAGGTEQVIITLNSSTGKRISLFNQTIDAVGGYFTVNLNAVLTCLPDEKWFLICLTFGDIKIKFTETLFYVSSTTINPLSTTYALPPLQLGQQLVAKMTNSRYTLKSNFFTVHNNIVAAGGEAIRNIKDAVLKTTFQDYFSSYNAIYNLGLKVVNDVIWIEPKADLYNDSSQIFDLGEVSQFSIGYAEEYLVNTVKIGYPVQDYGERNGRFEFNDTVDWKLPVTAVNKELDLTSKYRGDSYGIEFNRGALNNKDTTDNKGDNEVFLINIDNNVVTEGVSIAASKNPVNGFSGFMTFDNIILATGGIENYITYPTPITGFTFVNDNSQLARISFNASGHKDNYEGSFVLYVNGNVINSVYIPDNELSFRASISEQVTLNKGDIIRIACTVPVNLDSAGLEVDFIGVASVTTYNLKRGPYTIANGTLLGVPTDTVYNLEEMTPKRMLLAHGNYLRGLMYQLLGDKITFQTADKNKDLSTTSNGVTIAEKADVGINELANPLFLPFDISFTTKVPIPFAKIMSLLSAGDIKITYNNFPIYLLPIGDMKAKPVTNEAQDWKLIASPRNSLDTLLKLSQGATIIQDYMNNQIIVSDLNPVHFVRYDCVTTPDRTLVKPAIPPTGDPKPVVGVQASSWNSNGARIYAPNFPVNGLGSVLSHLTAPHFWVNGEEAIEVVNGSPTGNNNDGRMNANGIWVSNNITPGTVWEPTDEWIGFSRKVTLAVPKTLYVGISGDNCVRLKINGVEILNTTGSNVFDPKTGINFLTWSIYPVDFPAGDNYLEMSVMNTSVNFNSNPAGFACEIYDMTFSQLLQATKESDLNIIFRTRDMIGQPFDIGTTLGYSCEDGWVLEKDNAGVYTCVKTIKGNDCSDHHELNKKYHFKGIYDDRFQNRLDRYDSKAIYYQKWQTNDFINLQFLTVGYGKVELQIYDCQTNQIAIIGPTITPDTALRTPYVKQEFLVDLSQFDPGVYQFVIATNGVRLLISEWQQVLNDWPETILIEYTNTRNKPDAYFKTWKPSLRVEAFMPQPTPESTSFTYEDEPGDTEILSETTWMRQKFLLGDGYGLPDFMAKKLNRAILLDQVYMDGIEYTKVGDAKLETVELVQGYPMNYFTVDMRESKNQLGLVVSDVDLRNSFMSSLTLDAEAFGGSPGTIQTEID